MLLVVSRPKVLVVDDEENIRFLVGSALTVHELEVTAIDNGADALHHVRTESVDALVLDINLPDIDGFEVVRRLRQWLDGPSVISQCPRNHGGSGSRPHDGR